jgi:hypothetical protein
MEDKKAAKILMGLAKKYPLEDEEQEAIREAIGILTWTALSSSRLKKRKEKLDRSVEW